MTRAMHPLDRAPAPPTDGTERGVRTRALVNAAGPWVMHAFSRPRTRRRMGMCG